MPIRHTVCDCVERRSYRLTRVALIAMMLYGATARADDADTSMYSLNGFGTLGIVHSSEDKADFTGLGFKANGAGHAHDFSSDVDTRLGLQGLAQFTDKLSVTVQLIAEQDIHNQYAPSIEWANLKYSFTPDFSARIGRTAMPSYLYSDSRKVGYSIPWVRAPYEVYQLLPITNSDGVDASYRFRIGEVINTVQMLLGENVAEVQPGVKAKAEGVWGVFDTIEIGDFTFHVAYQGQQLHVEGFPGVGIPGNGNGVPLTFLTLGGRYDSGKWFVAMEGAKLKLQDSVTKSWYASGGYRVGTLSPYVTVAKQDAEAALFGFSSAQESYALGVRWDFMSKFDLKAEYQHLDFPQGAAGVLKNLQPGFQPGGEVDLFSVAIDFVF